MSLKTPESIRNFQKKLYLKAKAEPDYRFYLLYDKIYREDVLLHAYRLAKANGGAPGVDGKTFAMIETEGIEAWLAGLRERTTFKDVPAAASTVGNDPEAGRRREATWDNDHTGPGGANRNKAGNRTHS